MRRFCSKVTFRCCAQRQVCLERPRAIFSLSEPFFLLSTATGTMQILLVLSNAKRDLDLSSHSIAPVLVAVIVGCTKCSAMCKCRSAIFWADGHGSFGP